MELSAEVASTSGSTAIGCHGLSRPERLLRKAETVLANRTQRILLVLERCTDNQNYLACLRTAETLGLQHVWIVLAPRGRNEGPAGDDDDDGEAVGYVDKGENSRKRTRISKGSGQWLDLRTFATTRECIDALLADGREIWATDLAQDAIVLDGREVQLPARMALVMGREADGVSHEMLAAAHRRIALPMYGFNDSYNMSVSTGMLLHHLLLACPEARGDLPEDKKAALRAEWYSRLAKNEAQRAEFMERLANPPPPLAAAASQHPAAAPSSGPQAQAQGQGLEPKVESNDQGSASLLPATDGEADTGPAEGHAS